MSAGVDLFRRIACGLPSAVESAHMGMPGALATAHRNVESKQATAKVKRAKKGSRG